MGRIREIEIKYKYRELDRKFPRTVRSPKTVYKICADLQNEIVEIFRVLILNGQNRIIGYQDIARGQDDSVEVILKEIFLPAIAVHGNAIVCVHNHPDSSSEPSEPDLALFQALCKAEDITGVIIYDFMIIGEDDYCSLRDRNFTCVGCGQTVEFDNFDVDYPLDAQLCNDCIVKPAVVKSLLLLERNQKAAMKRHKERMMKLGKNKT